MRYRIRWIKAVATILLFGGCSNVAIMDLANQDLVGPAAVTQFKASPGTNQISLRWVNPADRDFKSVRIVRKTGAYPVSKSDGAIIYEGTETSAIDACTTNLTEYYYSAYAVDSSTNLSAPAKSKSASCSASLVCPSGYILVGANEAVNAYCQFCVAQYEMKNVSGVATSQATGTRWVYIDQAQARTSCSSLGTGYHLITNAERMAVAREIESTPANWSSGVVNSGSINQGWAAHTIRGDPWSNSGPPSISDNTCIYNSGADACAATGIWKFKRTHTISCGTIWDFSGSVSEWIDWNISDDKVILGPITAHQYEFTGLKPGAKMPIETWQPFNPNLNSTNGIGVYAGNGSSAGLYGGEWDTSGGPRAGIYNLGWTIPNSSLDRHGFRCTYVQ